MHEILDAENEVSYHYSNKSYQHFKQAIFIYLFFIIGVLIQMFVNVQHPIITLVFGLPVFVAIPLSFMGFIRGIKSILKQEPGNRKMFIGLVGNLVLIGLFLYLIFANIMDMQQQFAQ